MTTRTPASVWFARVCLLAVVMMFFVWPLVAAGIVAVWLIYRLGITYYYQVYLGRALERDLGFQHGNYVSGIGPLGPRRTLAIQKVHPNGVFERAGFREWDLIPISATDFFIMLHRHRGQAVEVPAIDCESDLPITERPRRIIRFEVPARAN